MSPPPRERRFSFDEVADTYHVFRPEYPAQLVADLASAAALDEHSRVLDVGCGPGTLTLPLSLSGAQIVAVELGPNLAAVARTRLATRANVRVLQEDFDVWTPAASSFDLVVVATALHWLDPLTRLQRCHASLRPGGTLAVIDTHWGTEAQASPFSQAIQSCYARWDPQHTAGFVPRTLADLPVEHDELRHSDVFQSVTLRRYSVRRSYDAQQLCGLLNTFSDVRAFGSANREDFLRCVRALVDTQFAGTVERSDCYSMWLARRD